MAKQIQRHRMGTAVYLGGVDPGELDAAAADAVAASPAIARVAGRATDIGELVSDTTGATLVHTELQAGLDALPAGAVVYNPPGAVVNLGAGITITKQLHFRGPGEYRFTAGIANAAALDVRADGTTLDGIHLSNPNELQASTGNRNWGIRIFANEVRVTRCLIDRFQTGIGVSSGEGTGGEFHGVVIANNRVKDVLGIASETRGDGIGVWGAAAVVTGNIVNAKDGHDSRCGIVVEGLGPGAVSPWIHENALATVTGNVVYGKFRRAIHAEAFNDITITGNTCADSTRWSITTAGCRNAIISDNVIKWTRTSGDVALGDTAPIYLLYCESMTVDGNLIDIVSGAETQYGIGASATTGNGTSYVSITNNTLIDRAGTCTSGGIRTTNITDNEVVIRGNRIAGTAGHGIYCYAASSGGSVTIAGNDVTGLSLAGIHAIHTVNMAEVRVLGNRMRAAQNGLLAQSADTVTIIGNDVDDVTTGFSLFGTAAAPVIALNHVGASVTTAYTNIPATSPLRAYTVTNLTTDRSYDADTVTVAELADVVGTLISDLRGQGIIR